MLQPGEGMGRLVPGNNRVHHSDIPSLRQNFQHSRRPPVHEDAPDVTVSEVPSRLGFW